MVADVTLAVVVTKEKKGNDNGNTRYNDIVALVHLSHCVHVHACVALVVVSLNEEE